MPDIKAQRRQLVRENLGAIVERVNTYLRGRNLASIEPVLRRLGRNQRLPHWYPQLRGRGTLPNLDGKTVGSVVEMLIVGDIEKRVLSGKTAAQLMINPAKGVDVPDLDLGIKSPSENWCTSEPFSNPYERLLGTEYDIIAVITNYQDAKTKPPLKIQLIHHHYFEGHEIADKGLCNCARRIRDRLLGFGEVPAQKAFKFLAFAVQSDWRCKALLKLMNRIDVPDELPKYLDGLIQEFDQASASRKSPLPPEDKQILEDLHSRKPLDRAIIEAADDWVVGKWREAGRVPNGNEWSRLLRSPLDGKLGVSFALQWRYNFGVFFQAVNDESSPTEPTVTQASIPGDSSRTGRKLPRLG